MEIDLENTKYRARTQNVTSGIFTVESGLKQGDTPSSILFNLALEKVEGYHKKMQVDY